ncbi:unnamed protein product [Rotaria sp. Silwood2]|nr:unnamed protein product [Rotaria sp. Silwood2]CAF2512864.1 unnamed protein product [Rotaria sp. Silwood2]CAF2874797.1 unnamed protein product [Rotaria sp. Silwood2]CAF4118640.1 unnamed protein product [Rotaria sp. Silwood2]CAF4180623.1 unnamed protein product [Rotaria sp. Silwood2]
MIDIPDCEMTWISSSIDILQKLLDKVGREIEEEEEEEEANLEIRATKITKDIQLDEKQYSIQSFIERQ